MVLADLGTERLADHSKGCSSLTAVLYKTRLRRG
jgi:hypothetical protein